MAVTAPILAAFIKGVSYTPNITSYTPYICIFIYGNKYVLGVRLMLGCDLYGTT